MKVFWTHEVNEPYDSLNFEVHTPEHLDLIDE